MPYRINPKNPKAVDHFKDGKWSIKQVCDSAENAKEALTVLNMKEHGKSPKGGWDHVAQWMTRK